MLFRRGIYLFLLLLLESLLCVLREEIALELSLILLARRGYDLGALLLGFLAWGAAVLIASGEHLLFLGRVSSIRAETLIDHVAVDIGIGFEATAIGGIA